MKQGRDVKFYGSFLREGGRKMKKNNRQKDVGSEEWVELGFVMLGLVW